MELLPSTSKFDLIPQPQIDLLDTYHDHLNDINTIKQHLVLLDQHVRSLHTNLSTLCELNLSKHKQDQAASIIQTWWRNKYYSSRTTNSSFNMHLNRINYQLLNVRQSLVNVMANQSKLNVLMQHHAAKLIQTKWRSIQKHHKPPPPPTSRSPPSLIDTQVPSSDTLSEADCSFLNQVTRSTSQKQTTSPSLLQQQNSTQYVSLDDFNYLKAEVEALRIELEQRKLTQTMDINSHQSIHHSTQFRHSTSSLSQPNSPLSLSRSVSHHLAYHTPSLMPSVLQQTNSTTMELQSVRNDDSSIHEQLPVTDASSPISVESLSPHPVLLNNVPAGLNNTRLVGLLSLLEE